MQAEEEEWEEVFGRCASMARRVHRLFEENTKLNDKDTDTLRPDVPLASWTITSTKKRGKHEPSYDPEDRQ